MTPRRTLSERIHEVLRTGSFDVRNARALLLEAAGFSDDVAIAVTSDDDMIDQIDQVHHALVSVGYRVE